MQAFEILLILIIIGIQGWSCWSTYKKIILFKSIFPDSEKFGISSVYLSEKELKFEPKSILDNFFKYSEKKEPSPFEAPEDERKYEISLIHSGAYYSQVLQKIKDSLNTYLLRNRSAVPEFNLIKDIIERNCDALEEQINASISVPLYLGLLGTFIGIILGLWNISGLFDNASTTDTTVVLNNAIPILLNGVKVAMGASLVGLGLTILNSALFFRNSKAVMYSRKSDFFTFLQIELFPLLNHGMNDSFNSLQTNFQKFNSDFSANINSLTKLMTQNHDALLAQEKVLTVLDNLDITEFGKANVKVLKELQSAIGSFHAFNLYIESVNKALQNTDIIVAKLSNLIDQSENMNMLAKNINSSFAENKQLMVFLQSHYSELDSSKQMISESVANVSVILKRALEELQGFTQESIIEMKQVIIREIRLMDTEYPEKWKKLDNLDNLTKLNEIKNDLNQIKINSSGQLPSVKQEINNLNILITTTNQTLEEIRDKESYLDKVRKKIKNWYYETFKQQ